jgi:hypothetical protein
MKETTTIPATRGTRFGFKYEITGLSADQIELRGVFIYPPIRRPNGSIVTTHELPLSPTMPRGGRVVGMIGYGFDEEYEAVPGQWTMQVWRRNKMVVEQTFNVYKP